MKPYSINLEEQQAQMIFDFFDLFPQILIRERVEHGFDPLSNLGTYMAQELFDEPYHVDVRDQYIQNYRLTPCDLKRWMTEEMYR